MNGTMGVNVVEVVILNALSMGLTFGHADPTV
jgi:hypothetical protein